MYENKATVVRGESDPLGVGPEAVQYPAISLGTPKGVLRNRTISPNNKPPEEAFYPPGRMVLIAVIVSVIKCGGESALHGPQEEQEAPLERTTGVTQDGKYLVLWREIRVPGRFQNFTVSMKDGLPTVSAQCNFLAQLSATPCPAA